jgi:hypothetical protein
MAAIEDFEHSVLLVALVAAQPSAYFAEGRIRFFMAQAY